MLCRRPTAGLPFLLSLVIRLRSQGDPGGLHRTLLNTMPGEETTVPWCSGQGEGRGRPGGPPRVPMPAWGSLPQPMAPRHIPAATRTSALGLVLPGPPGRRYRLQVTLEVDPAEAQGSGPLSWDPSKWQHLPGTLVPRKTHLKREVTRLQGGASMSRGSPPGPKDGQIPASPREDTPGGEVGGGDTGSRLCPRTPHQAQTPCPGRLWARPMGDAVTSPFPSE